MLTDIFTSLIEVSITIGIIILALMLLSSMLNKAYAAKWKYWIWLILAVRLILPLNFSFPQAPVQLNMPDEQIVVYQPEDSVPIQALPVPQTAPNIESAEHAITLVQIGMMIWLAGFLLFLIREFIGYRLFRKQALRWSCPILNEQIVEQLNRLSSEMGIKKQIVPLISEKVSSPMMLGFIKPLLFLPHENYADADLRFILKHELIHTKRRDIWYKLLLLFANAVHWFNPLVYLMFREASKDMELSCDDEVTKGASFDERKQYSETILASIRHQYSHQTTLSTYFYGGAKTMKERFGNILDTKKKRNGSIVFLIVLVSVAIVGGMVSCRSERADGHDDNLDGPVTGTKEKIVLIDPGHGGVDEGAIYTEGSDIEIKEKELNLKISQLLQGMLKESGVRAETTRQEDQGMTLEDRMELAESLNASLFVNIHFGYSPDSSLKGTLTEYNSLNDAAVYGITGEKAAQLIHEAVVNGLGTESIRVEPMSESRKYGSLRMPVVVVTPAFMSNTSDRQRLMADKFCFEAAKALHDGIIAVLGEM